MRSGIALLLVLGLMTAGCDRQSPGEGQAAANQAAPADAADAATVDRSHAGDPEPSASFTNPAGRTVTLSDFAGKPVLLNLWATWCAPCIAEMPTLDTLAGTLGDKVRVLTVSQDLGGADKVEPFFQNHSLPNLPHYLDPDLSLSTAYGVNLPTTILYGADGKEVWRVSGGMDWTSDQAKKLLAEAKG